jgi:hypothetical protein
VTDLRQRHPELAARFTGLRDLLNGAEPLAGDSPAGPGGWGGPDRHRVAARFAATVEEIRRLPGFDMFLLPPSLDTLRAEAEAGPVALFNTSQHRADAFLLTPAGVEHLPLPGLTLDRLADRIATFRGALLDANAPMPARGGESTRSGTCTTSSPGCGTSRPARSWTGWGSTRRRPRAPCGRGYGGCPVAR